MVDHSVVGEKWYWPGPSIWRGREKILIWGAVILISVAIGYLNVRLYGDIKSTLTLIFVTVFVGISVLRPSISLYVFVFVAIAVEQAELPYGWTKDIPYHLNLNSQFPSMRSLSINPVELHLLCVIAGVLIRHVIVRNPWTPIIAGKALLAYFLSISFFVTLGLWRGGATLPAMWEIRGIGYLMLLMVLVPQVIQTRQQITRLMWALLAGATFRALEVTYHFVQAGFSIEGSVGGWGSHEDAGFYALSLVFLATLWVLKTNDGKQRTFLTFASILFVLAIVSAGRRSAYPILIASLILLPLMLPRDIQRKVIKIAWKLGIVFALYLAVFWQSRSENLLLTPVRAIREGFAGDDESQAGERYLSNLFRKVENYDLYLMVRTQPILGTGYGMLIDYRMPIPVGWELGFYIPHNQILAVPAKTGVVGYFIFMCFYLAIAAQISSGFHRFENDRYLQAVLVLVGAAIVCHLIFSFFDIILTYYRPNILTGALFGLASAIFALKKTEEAKSKAVPAAPSVSDAPIISPNRWLLGVEKKESTSV